MEVRVILIELFGIASASASSSLSPRWGDVVSFSVSFTADTRTRVQRVHDDGFVHFAESKSIAEFVEIEVSKFAHRRRDCPAW